MLPRLALLPVGMALLALVVGVKEASAQPPRAPSRASGPSHPAPANSPDLRSDARLYARLSADLSAPTVEEVLEELQRVTRVTLTIDPRNVETKDPAFFAVRLHNMPAWSVMQRLARSKVVRGYWVKDGDGYQLVGTVEPRPGVSSTGSPSLAFWATVAVSGILLVVSTGLAIRWWRKRPRSTPVHSPAPATGPAIPTTAPSPSPGENRATAPPVRGGA